MIVRRSAGHALAVSVAVLALVVAFAAAGDATAWLVDAGAEPSLPTESAGGARELVRTDAGWVRGQAGDGDVTFSGIPYAAPPVGERRWAPPAPAQPWSGVRDATAPAATCPQAEYGPDGPTVVGDEDCLYLNVTTPRAARAARGGRPLPVVVWWHGGMFVSGAGSEYDGARLATGGDVVVVTANYRLGALGFLSSPALDGEGHPSGNYGIEDQAAALRWVQRNAARFGGDPANVTLAGQSAKARGVCSHLASPGSAGLFHRAITQSGPCAIDLVTKPVADERGARVAAEVGCAAAAAPDVVACLRDRPVADLLATLADVGGPVNGRYADEAWQAVVGTPVLPTQPIDAIAGGSAVGTPLLVGTTRDEMRTFVGYAFDAGGTPLTADGYRAQVNEAFGPDTAAVLAEYPVEAYPSPVLALATVLGDWGGSTGSCPALRTAEAASQHADVFAYELTEPSGVTEGTYPLGSYHSWDLPFLWDLSIPGAEYPEPTPGQQVLSASMIEYWTSFARTGDPNTAGEVAWPEFGAGGTVLGLAAGEGGVAPTPFARTHHCGFWNAR